MLIFIAASGKVFRIFSAAVVAVVDVAVGTIVTVRVTTESIGSLDDDVITIC